MEIGASIACSKMLSGLIALSLLAVLKSTHTRPHNFPGFSHSSASGGTITTLSGFSTVKLHPTLQTFRLSLLHTPIAEMASIARTGLFRQTFASPVRSNLSSLTTRTQRQLVLQTALRSWRIAAFHTSQSRALLPPLPQRIEGTVNDPQPLPHVSPMHGSYHWTFERYDRLDVENHQCLLGE